MHQLLKLLLLCACLAACGQKGGLYIPQEQSLQAQAHASTGSPS